MQLKAQDLFPRLESYRVVADLGLEIQEQEGLFFTPHPQDSEHLLQIDSHEFIGRPDGLTPACNVFDFLALYYDGSYSKAVDYVINQYHNLASLPLGLRWDAVRDQMVEGLRADREQFQNILSLQCDLPNRSAQAYAYMYCGRNGFDPDHIWRMLYIVRGKDLQLVLQHVPGWRTQLKSDESYVVYPYFKNRHTYALLEICDLHEKPVGTVHLNPSQHSFFGLHTCFPGNQETQVWSTQQEAAIMYSRAVQNGDFQIGSVHMRFNPDGEPGESPLKSGVLIVTKNADFNTVVSTRRAFEQLEVLDPEGRFADATQPVAWPDYGVNSVLKALKEDPKDLDRVYSLSTSGMIESLRSDPVVFPALLRALESRNQTAVVRRIQRQTGGRRLFVLGGTHISETPDGYVATKPGTNLNSRFTNFVLKLDSRIWFEETQETFFSGWLGLDRQFVPFLLSNSQMHQPKTILLQAQLAANRAANPNLSLPTIADSTQQAKLVAIISQQIPHTAKIVGVHRLGWSRTKDRFIAPVWQVGHHGLEATSKVAHPKSETLARYFSFVDYALTEDLSHTTAQARYLIALLAACLVRGFLNLQTPPVRILRSPQSFSLLQSVFRPLGQVAPVELTPNRRAIQQTLLHQNLSRYPIFATCSELKALERINYPLFLLAQAGVPLSEPLTSDAVLQITSLSHRVITSVVLTLIREPAQAQGLILRDQAASIEQLALEGQQIIEAGEVIKQLDLADRKSPLLEQVLSRIQPENAGQYFSCKPQDGLVVIRCRELQALIPGVTREPLYAQLRAQNPHVKLRGKHYISCPTDWFLDLLAKFYGRAIVLSHPNGPKSGSFGTL